MADKAIRRPPIGPDEATFSKAHVLLEAYLEETDPSGDFWNIKPGDYDSGRTILNETEDLHASIVREGFERLVPSLHQYNTGREQTHAWALDALLKRILRFPLPLRDEDILFLLELL